MQPYTGILNEEMENLLILIFDYGSQNSEQVPKLNNSSFMFRLFARPSFKTLHIPSRTRKLWILFLPAGFKNSSRNWKATYVCFLISPICKVHF